MNNNIKFLSYRIGYVIGDNINKKRLVYRILKNTRNKKKINLFNKNLNLNLIHTKEISNLIMDTYQTAEGIYNLTVQKKISLKNFYVSLKKKIFLKEKNPISSKIYKDFKNIKKINYNKTIEYFKNGN